MKTHLTVAAALALAACSSAHRAEHPAPSDPPAPTRDLAALVNPFIGTLGGETWPGADLPFGMIQWSPELTKGDSKRAARPGGYAYDAPRARGFSLTHMSGTGCRGGYGDIPFFPFTKAITTSPSADGTDAIYATGFDHAREAAEPGYYRVTLDDGVAVELAVTMRTGSGRFTFPAGAPATLLVRTSSSEVGSEQAEARVDVAHRTISGSVTSGNFCGYLDAESRRSYYTLYFHAELDQPFTATGGWHDAAVTPGATDASGGTGYGSDGYPPVGKGSGVYVAFAPGADVRVRVGISFVSAASARANLVAENPPGTTLEAVRTAARAAWNQRLARIDIAGGSHDQQVSFYTALYHALLHPNVFNDVDGAYVGMDQKVHRVAGEQQAQYANFSGWDVYRGQLQLIALVEPLIASDIAQSLLNQADQNGGVWDRWTHGPGGTHVMAGDPAHAAVPNLYAFGASRFDAARALTSMVRAATTVTAADRSKKGAPVMAIGERPSLDHYLAHHYVPADGNAWGGAGETLEDVNADFGIAQLALRLGKRDLHAQFLARSGYWRNVFNPEATPGAGYMQDRNADGTWSAPFDPGNDEAGFAEGSSAQYTWMIPFDARGLFEIMGGSARAIARLDAFFHRPDGSWALTKAGGVYFEMNNEPSIGAPWMYGYAGAPHKTQETVRAVMDRLFRNAPDGLPGQDDLGAMSAWYVWSALGLYPQYPGRAELLVAAPLFTRAVVHRGNGATLTIEAAAAGATYVQALTVDGKPWTRAWLPETAIAGAHLVYTLATTPQPWGAAAADAPPSFAP